MLKVATRAREIVSTFIGARIVARALCKTTRASRAGAPRSIVFAPTRLIRSTPPLPCVCSDKPRAQTPRSEAAREGRDPRRRRTDHRQVLASSGAAGPRSARSVDRW